MINNVLYLQYVTVRILFKNCCGDLHNISETENTHKECSHRYTLNQEVSFAYGLWKITTMSHQICTNQVRRWPISISKWRISLKGEEFACLSLVVPGHTYDLSFCSMASQPKRSDLTNKYDLPAIWSCWSLISGVHKLYWTRYPSWSRKFYKNPS